MRPPYYLQVYTPFVFLRYSFLIYTHNSFDFVVFSLLFGLPLPLRPGGGMGPCGVLHKLQHPVGQVIHRPPLPCPGQPGAGPGDGDRQQAAQQAVLDVKEKFTFFVQRLHRGCDHLRTLLPALAIVMAPGQVQHIAHSDAQHMFGIGGVSAGRCLLHLHPSSFRARPSASRAETRSSSAMKAITLPARASAA